MNIDKIEFDNDLFVQLQAETEMDPNQHDGSYELVQETVKAYKNVSIDELNYLDLNCIYLMTVGTWKHSFDKKEETINKSNLADEEKTHLISVLRKIQKDAENSKYENRESGNPTCGMFGTGFYNFQTKTNDNSVRQFIKLCLDILSEDDEEKLFVITEEALKTKINGMQTGSISQILHCLKPTVFPILNGHMQQDTIFEKFSIDIKDSKDSTQYISNCRKIKKFRDDNFNFKNYRIMDKFTTDIESNQNNKKVWKLSHGKDFSEDEVQYYLSESTVCVHKDTSAKGVSSLPQGKAFTDEAKSGDLFYLCRGNQEILLIGEFISDEVEIDEEGWAYRKYNKLYSAIKEGSYEGPNKWWTPNNNSTFIEIKTNEYSEFEKLILVPFFGINLKTLNLVSGENEMDNINECRKLLENTHNLILHGAPGTGKTHLAKEIAKGLNENNLKLSIQGFESFISQPGYLEKNSNSSDPTGNIQRYESIAAKLVGRFGSFEEIAKEADFIKSEFKTEKDEAGKMDWDNNQIVIDHIKNYVDANFQKLGDSIGFVQFHPSYDYTDFVEGLRPVHKNEEVVSFEKTDGIFKKFCIKALENYKDTNGTDNFDECYDKLIEKIEKENFVFVDTISKTTKFRVEQNEYENGLTTRTYPKDEYKKGEWIPGHSRFYTKEQLYNIYRGLPGVPKGGHDNYRKAIIQYMKDNLNLKDYKPGIKSEENQKFVFIIDEINRGELSKIFGELFYSIDPGYRINVPKLDKQNLPVTIKTQYSNMQDGPNQFDIVLGEQEDFGHFFIPDNVYIIGTMNDIDRSVESMDFAFRRRFTFKEITAKDTQKSILSGKDGLDDTIRNEAIQRMDSLNDAIYKKTEKIDSNGKKTYDITGIEGLSSAYHIGGAYFLKLKDLGNDFKKLWDYHLSGLLREYLRGMEDSEELLEKLNKAYNLENQD